MAAAVGMQCKWTNLHNSHPSSEDGRVHRSQYGVSCTAMKVVLLIVVCLCTVTCVNAQMDMKDIQTFLDALQDPEGQLKDENLSTGWGIADKSTPMGKLFQYTIPNEAFKGTVTHFQIKELGKDKLPNWLNFDDATNTILGVPGTDELEKEYHLEVSAVGQFENDTASQSKDIFSVKVYEDMANSDTAATKLVDAVNEGIQPIKCPARSSVTVATIIVDVDLAAMMPREKVGLMRGMCSHMGLPPDVLRVSPVGDKPMFDSSALVAGPGNVKQALHPGAMIQWEVGCGNVHAHHMPILQQLETSSQDGSMAEAVNQGIVGWHVTNNKPPAVRRIKRQTWVQPTATVVPTGSPPTQRPIPTKIIDGKDTTDLTHTVPTMTSPSFTDPIRPTTTKSKDRTKTSGRHHHRKTRTKTRKPKKTRTKTKHHKPTIMPTSTQLPIRPTRTTDVIPTDVNPVTPIVSRTTGVIEPSMRPTKTQPTQPTEMLPSTTPPLPPAVSTKPMPTGTQTPSTDKVGLEATVEAVNSEPDLINDIKRIEVQVGDVLSKKVPSNTFHDQEDGNTKNLKLALLSIDGLSLPRNSWLKLNQTTQTLYGLPMPQHEGRQEYSLVAIDSGGKISRDTFEIVVTRRPHDRRISHEFSMTLNLSYEEFLYDVDKRIDVAQKVASVYGDKDMSKITVTKIQPGSVIYAWTNNSLPLEPCPVDDITKLLQYLITKNDTLNESFVEAMRPYRVMRVGAEPMGSCEDEASPTAPPSTDPDVNAVPRETSQEDILISTLVPALIIAAMLLVAGCIACILYRKNRKGKLSDEDQQTFINKGIPIIFADELEDKPDPPTKPLIMNEEKPPQHAPPNYQRSTGGSVMSTPPSDHKEPLLDTEDEREEGDMSPYRPPPPVTGSQGNRGVRPHAQPPYRQPPPYVPP